MPAAVPYVIAAVAAGAQAYNTRQTNRRQDRQAADSIRNQSERQRKIDQRVGEEIDSLEGSSSADERAGSLQAYSDQLRRNRAVATEGLTPVVGGSRFAADATKAAQGVEQYGADTAGLMSRIDAPLLQRRGEAVSQGYLGTDISLESRAAAGQADIDRLRLAAIQRNPWIDAAAQFGQAYAGGMAGGGAGAGGMTAMMPQGQGVLNHANGGNAAPGPWAGGYQYPQTYKPRTW